MKSRNANNYDDENYDFDDDSSDRLDDDSDDLNEPNADGLNFIVEEGDGATYDPELDVAQLDLYNLDDYGEELSPEEDDFDDDFDEDFINLSDDDAYNEMFPEERVSDGDAADSDGQEEEEIDEFDDLNADENVYGGEEEL